MNRQPRRSEIEIHRRQRVEARERQLDQNEQYERDLALAVTKEERESISNKFAEQRQKNREAEVRAGFRPLGNSILLHQVMWMRWMEAAVEQEGIAQETFTDILSGKVESLGIEFRASLVSLTASAYAYAIEALYGDIKYLIPEQTPQRRRHQTLSRAFQVAFGLLDPDYDSLTSEMRWLFERRDMAVHPYSDAELPKPHPSGVNTSAEHADFNAQTSRQAVDAALQIMSFARIPPNAYSRWITRWSERQASYFTQVFDVLQFQRNESIAERANGSVETEMSSD
jgi:hypothetical protein